MREQMTTLGDRIHAAVVRCTSNFEIAYRKQYPGFLVSVARNPSNNDLDMFVKPDVGVAGRVLDAKFLLKCEVACILADFEKSYFEHVLATTDAMKRAEKALVAYEA